MDRVPFKDFPRTADDDSLRDKWLKLLQQQKYLHDAELAKWQQFIRATVKLLQQVKSIYTKFSIELEKITEKAQDEL